MLNSALSAAAKYNVVAGLPTLHVYSPLTDLEIFKFYSYHPELKLFFFDMVIMTNNRREEFFIDMIGGINYHYLHSTD